MPDPGPLIGQAQKKIADAAERTEARLDRESLANAARTRSATAGSSPR
jgi:hypothetical protein